MTQTIDLYESEHGEVLARIEQEDWAPYVLSFLALHTPSGVRSTLWLLDEPLLAVVYPEWHPDGYPDEGGWIVYGSAYQANRVLAAARDGLAAAAVELLAAADLVLIGG